MPAPKPSTDKPVPKTESAATVMTAILAAKAVGVQPDDVWSFRDYGDYVVVATIDGRKLSNRTQEAD